jgi:Zn-finger nucleic acid-binding protein
VYRESAFVRVRCPCCQTAGLDVREVGHVALDECGRCGGVWVGNDVLAALIDDVSLHAAMRAAFPDGKVDSAAVPLACPTCRDEMSRRKFAPGADVVIDRCPAHGVWFDAHELPRVVAFVSQRGPEGLRHATRNADVPGVKRAPPDPPAKPQSTAGAVVEFLLSLLGLAS